RQLLPELDRSPEADLLHLKAIAQVCHLPVMRDVRTIRRVEAVNLSERTAFEAETRYLSIPEGDSIYFPEAGTPTDLPAIRVYAIPGGTVSFDLSRRGNTQLYVFDSRGYCISEMARGIAPFISEPCIHACGMLGLLNDSHSSAMNICHFLLDN